MSQGLVTLQDLDFSRPGTWIFAIFLGAAVFVGVGLILTFLGDRRGR